MEGNPWDTPDEFLMTLCEECHEEETLIRRTGEKFLLLVLRRKKFLASDIDYLAHTISNAPVIEKRDAESLLTVIDWSLRNKEEILRMRYERDFKRIGELRNG